MMPWLLSPSTYPLFGINKGCLWCCQLIVKCIWPPHQICLTLFTTLGQQIAKWSYTLASFRVYSIQRRTCAFSPLSYYILVFEMYLKVLEKYLNFPKYFGSSTSSCIFETSSTSSTDKCVLKYNSKYFYLTPTMVIRLVIILSWLTQYKLRNCSVTHNIFTILLFLRWVDRHGLSYSECIINTGSTY